MRVVRRYWVSLAALAVLSAGLLVLVATTGSGNGWRAAQRASQAAFDRHLRMVEAEAAATDARDLAQQAASDLQADSSARAGAPTSAPVRRATARPSSSNPSHTPAPFPQTDRFPGPLASGAYVDCASVGHVVSVQDPSSDLETLYSPWLAPKFPSVDLTKVSVAVAGENLCVDFTAMAPPIPTTFYSFELGSPQVWSATGPSLRIDVVFGAHGERAAALRYPGDDESPTRGIVRARVGISGSSTSLLIDRRLFPSYVPSPPWWWSGEGVGWTGLRSPQQVTDTDTAGQPASYP
jgi:hypothetical protein